MKLKYFSYGVLSASLVGYLGLLVIQGFENPMEKAKVAFLVIIGLSTFSTFALKDGRMRPLRKQKPKEQKNTHWASLAAARQPVKVESNTDEIHHLIEDLAVKAREANELIFQHKLDAQLLETHSHEVQSTGHTEKSLRNS
ncbi:MAG: hypothetical protein IPK04_02825 [Bdellovibrionales bacterium]|nr:hypothetical protein [Bdellovibrionales bacterium]